jgi:hypothetical protein
VLIRNKRHPIIAANKAIGPWAPGKSFVEKLSRLQVVRLFDLSGMQAAASIL